ncbi:MAG: GNAT family N-acetyltransferase [Planctomycetes bacterium]|nr:GNAT family N-acetyltransferase [Planctomycetota bacterium]
MNDGNTELRCHTGEKLALIEGVFVRAEYRRRGVGTRIMTKVMAVAQDAGGLHMRRKVKWDNPAAIALYREYGFALTDITERRVAKTRQENPFAPRQCARS